MLFSEHDHRGEDAQTTASSGIFDQLESDLRSATHRKETPTLLRALSRPLLHALYSMRQEDLERFERRLLCLDHLLTAELTREHIEKVESDPRYLLGYVDALLSLSGQAINREVAEKVMQAARRAHVI